MSGMGKTGHHFDTMWYDREHALWHIGEIGILSVRFLLLSPPVSYVWYPKCTTQLHCVGLVIIEIWIDLPPVLWGFRLRLQLEPGGGKFTCRVIASSGCRLSQIVRWQVFLIITGELLWIKGWLTGSWSHCRGDGNAAW
jgi:hypothetical protein